MSSELIPLGQIHDNPYQGRQDYTEIDALGRSIAEHGLQAVPKARKNGKGVELKFGHRRYRAFVWLSANWKDEGLPDRYQGYTVMPLDIEELTNEQMYIGAVIENNDRNDPNDIEIAAMLRMYRQEFGKTSDEAGKIFGKTGSWARGKERLLDAPASVQKALIEKTISEGTVRSLMSMAKVASEKEIADTLKDIVENEDGETPEKIVEDAIDRLDQVVRLWDGSWRQGEPRAGSDGWKLDMKNFPNKMLSSLSRSDLNAIGIEDTSSNMVLATRYLNGEDAYVPPELKTKIDHLRNPPACTACPFYMVMNKSHYCGMEVCYERKSNAYQRQKLEDTSRSIKIPVYQDSDGPYIALDEMVTSHKKAFEARHADLRLVPKSQFPGYAYQNFKGLDSSVVKLVAVGESLEKLAVRSSKTVGKKSEKEKAEQRAMRRYRQVRKDLMWEYTATAQSIFEGVPMTVLKKLSDWHFIGIDDRIPDEFERNPGGDKLEYQRRALVWRLIMGTNSHYSRYDLGSLLGKFEAITGVKATKALVKHAQEWDAEIAGLASVSAETKGKKK